MFCATKGGSAGNTRGKSRRLASREKRKSRQGGVEGPGEELSRPPNTRNHGGFKEFKWMSLARVEGGVRPENSGKPLENFKHRMS